MSIAQGAVSGEEGFGAGGFVFGDEFVEEWAAYLLAQPASEDGSGDGGYGGEGGDP